MSLAYLHAFDCQANHSDAIWALAQPSSDTIITGSADGSLALSSSSTGQPLELQNALPPPHTLGITSLSTNRAGTRALWNSLEGTTGLLDLETGGAKAKYASFERTGEEGEEPSWSTSLHPNEAIYASTGASGTVWLHSAQEEEFGKRIKNIGTGGKTKFGMCIRWAPTSSNLALSSESGQIYVYDGEAAQLVNTFTSHAMPVRNVSWSADSSLLVSASDDRHLTLHDLRTSKGGAVGTLAGHNSWVLSADVSLDGKYIVSGSADAQIKIWDIASRQCVSTIVDSGEVWAVGWRPDFNNPTAFLATGGDQGVAKVWRAAGAGQ